MGYNVDVDEADVAVLNLNLNKCKDAFTNINKSLDRISARSANASKNIKPILKDVNQLNDQKKQLEKGISMLQEVSDSAAIISEYEDVLANSIEVVGLNYYLKTLQESKQYFKMIKPKMKRFTNLMINFDNNIDKSDIKLQTFFVSLVKNIDINDKIKFQELKTILAYYKANSNNNNANVTTNFDSNGVSIYVKTRRDFLYSKLKQFEPATKPLERPANIPYEKGSNGINRFNNEATKAIKEEVVLLDALELSSPQIVKDIIDKTVSELYNQQIINNFNHFFSNSTVIVNNDLLILEIIENFLNFKNFLILYNIDNLEFNNSVKFFVTKSSILFKEYFKLIESKFTGQPLTETNIPQILVDLISKVRRVSEFQQSCLEIALNYKLGDWLIIKPPARFISVYSSLILNSNEDTSPEYLLSSFFSDLIDCIMVNIEIGLKNNEIISKKSTQGFILIKNLIMVETIINKSKSLYSCLDNIGMERINKLKNRFLKLFLDDWNYASYIIIRDMTSIATSSAHSGGISSGSTGLTGGHMTSKEREQIKELFKTFNESFEEALRNYERYNITDSNLRSYLSTEIKKLITSAYFKLYDKYGEGDFTKNKSKYVKYDKQSFERLLNDKL